MHVFRLTIRPLGDSFHGRGDGGEPEWPPSPLRAFQALVNAAAGHWGPGNFKELACPALAWLEELGPPDVVAPPGRAATRPYRLYVPNNAGDLMVSAWARGNTDASMAEHRTEKDVRPTRFADGEPVHYVWPLTVEEHAAGTKHLEVLKAAARSITHLGWGVDMAVGDAAVISTEEADKVPGDRWRPVESGGVPLRVPVAGTLQNLTDKHAVFLGRLSADGFKPVPPLTAFKVVGYHSPTAAGSDPPERPIAAFQLLAPDASKVISFPARRARDVAAWVRNAVGEACDGWPFEDVGGFVHGHDPADANKPLKGADADVRFAFLPLPTINAKLGRVEAIRRVLVAAPPGRRDRVEYVRRRLPGRDLVFGGRPVGLLNLLPASDWVLGQYTRESARWSTVTPVLLPGYDDRDRAKAERLIREAFGHAGVPTELATTAEVEFGPFGFRAGVEPVREYTRPENLQKFPAYHVRVTFARPVRGPLAVGAGRYRGLGLFAAE